MEFGVKNRALNKPTDSTVSARGWKGKAKLRQALNSKVLVVFVRQNLEAALSRFREAPPKDRRERWTGPNTGTLVTMGFCGLIP